MHLRQLLCLLMLFVCLSVPVANGLRPGELGLFPVLLYCDGICGCQGLVHGVGLVDRACWFLYGDECVCSSF